MKTVSISKYFGSRLAVLEFLSQPKEKLIHRLPGLSMRVSHKVWPCIVMCPVFWVNNRRIVALFCLYIYIVYNIYIEKIKFQLRVELIISNFLLFRAEHVTRNWFSVFKFVSPCPSLSSMSRCRVNMVTSPPLSGNAVPHHIPREIEAGQWCRKLICLSTKNI